VTPERWGKIRFRASSAVMYAGLALRRAKQTVQAFYQPVAAPQVMPDRDDDSECPFGGQHPSTQCCGEEPCRADCPWLAARCRACDGDGYCPRCRGDGTQPSAVHAEPLPAAAMGLTDEHRILEILREHGGLALYESEAGDITVECILEDGTRDVFTSFSGSDDGVEVVSDLVGEIDRLRARVAELEGHLAGKPIAEMNCSCAGSCEGRDTLAPGRYCQLDRRER
jgi:hypothetical protein